MTSNIQMQSALKSIEVFNQASSNCKPLWVRKSGDLRLATDFEKFTLKIMETFKIWPSWKIQAREQIYKKITSEINVLHSLKNLISENTVKDFVKDVTADGTTAAQINEKKIKFTNIDENFGNALKFVNRLKESPPENYQSILNVANYIEGDNLSILDDINNITYTLKNNKNYSKNDASKLAPMVFLLKKELALELEDALNICQAALKLSKKNKVPYLRATKNLIENVKKINPALPRGCDIKKLLTSDFKVDLKIPDEKNEIFVKFLIESAGDSISLDDEIPDFCLRDLNRSYIKFKVGEKEKSLSPGHQSEMIEAITNLDSNTTVRSTLCKAIFQAGGNGIITSYAQIFAKENNQILGLLNFCPEKDDQGSKAHFEISIEKEKSGNFTINYALHEKHFALVDPESGENYPINSNFDSSKPASKDDFTGFSKFTIELNRSDLELGKR